MKHLLVLAPTLRDRRELGFIEAQGEYRFTFHDFDCDALEQFIYKKHIKNQIPDHREIIRSLVHGYHDIVGIITTDDYPGSLLASIVAQEKNLIGPAPKAIITAQHKYYCRQLLKPTIPEAIPDFALVHRKDKKCALQFPCFVKPIKSSFSLYATKIASQQELLQHLQMSEFHPGFLHFFNDAIKKYTNFEHSADHLIAEQVLHGEQSTLEGFVYNRQITCLAIVDSVMYPGTMSFARFEIPSRLTQSVQDRMKQIAVRAIAHLGLDNTFFNIEFMYDSRADRISIIEINPRMVGQFADLYEKVLGINSYQLLIDLALGKNPRLDWHRGKYACAASFALRVFEDRLVLQVPSFEEIKSVNKKFPDVRIEIWAEPGKLLSQSYQDGSSYRYAVINLGASDPGELGQKVSQITQLLPFKFHVTFHD